MIQAIYTLQADSHFLLEAQKEKRKSSVEQVPNKGFFLVTVLVGNLDMDN